MTLTEIVAAVKKLKPNDFLRLRKQLDRLEQKQWVGELTAVTGELQEAGINDSQIDRMIMRRRREGRS